MADPMQTDVLVVGAGPSGLCVALCLLRGGKRVRIIDSGGPIRKESYALALHPSSLEAFGKLGILDKLLQHGRRISRVVYLQTGAVHATVEFSHLESEFPFVLVVPQNVLEEVLLDEIEKHDAVVEWNHALVDLAQDGSGVSGRVAVLGGKPRGPYVNNVCHVEQDYLTFRADCLVGADGYFSTVRRLLGVRMKTHGSVRNFVVYELETDERLKDELRVETHPHGPAVFWPMPMGRCRWTFETPMPPQEAPTGLELMALLQLRAPWFYTVATRDRWGARLSFVPALAERFGEGRVWMLGDAVHQALPFGVHSMNAGFQEAVLLSECILTPGTEAERARRFAAYEARCGEDWRFLIGAGGSGDPEIPTDPWIASNRELIRYALPASGDHLKALLEQVSPQSGRDLVSGMFALPDL